MKKNGKKLGVGGTLLVIVLYVILQWTGLIGTEEAENTAGNNAVVQQTTEVTKAPAITDSPEATDAPQVTEGPKATDAPQVTEAPKATDKPEATEAPKATATPAPTEEPVVTEAPVEIELTDYGFRNKKLRDSHFDKHGIEMGFETVEDYIEAANKVISNPDALHKLEAEDNDHIYFIEETNEFVVLSQDGYIRTYYIANGGIDYFNRQ
ncbi:MAG: hypothetical protein IJ379_07870 [Lachnospiraceae bacterium]|nr:hypothetical protein [Lachnospiraceae bacterium]MBQ7775824.1 hypothetical protein [Lachnospiraceae bacterium]